MRDIGKNIKTLRIKKKMSQDELAEKLYVTRQTISNYETGRSRPDVEMLSRIAELLETDINTLVYGETKTDFTYTDKRQLLIAAISFLLLAIFYFAFIGPAKKLMANYFISGPNIFLEYIILPATYVLASWTVMRTVSLVTKTRPLNFSWVIYIRFFLFTLLLSYFVLMLPTVYHGIKSMLVHFYVEKIRGDLLMYFHGYSAAFSLEPKWLGKIQGELWRIVSDKTYLFFILGLFLWLFGFPKKKERNYVSVLIAFALSLLVYLCAKEEFKIEVYDPSGLENAPYGIEVIQTDFPAPEWEIN